MRNIREIKICTGGLKGKDPPGCKKIFKIGEQNKKNVLY